MRILIVLCLLIIGGCTASYNTGGIRQVPGQLGEDPDRAEQVFFEVLTDIRPVAISECRARRADDNCEFLIVVDLNPRAEPNAFMSRSRDGRPLLAVSASMIASFQNADELAFVISHEVAHHILMHLELQKEAASAGAERFGEIAADRGGSVTEIRRAKQIGAQIGARVYSQRFEFEADQLGAIITAKSGYDPEIGARYFERLPEPGEAFLASHPPNEARQALVQRTVEELDL